jgi:hypothetical protein
MRCLTYETQLDWANRVFTCVNFAVTRKTHLGGCAGGYGGEREDFRKVSLPTRLTTNKHIMTYQEVGGGPKKRLGQLPFLAPRPSLASLAELD